MATSSLALLNPYGSTWAAWCAAFVQGFADEYNVPNPVAEGLWLVWAVELLNNSSFAGLGVPDPRGSRTWQDWAAQTMQVIS